MRISYDSRADVLYMFATAGVTDAAALEQSPRRQPGVVGEGLTIYGDRDKTILGVRCENASTRLNLAGLPLGGMQVESAHIIERALANLKTVLDSVYFDKTVLDSVYFDQT